MLWGVVSGGYFLPYIMKVRLDCVLVFGVGLCCCLKTGVIGFVKDFKSKSRGVTYFGENFMMGGEKFELAKPEAFLFGDNTDLHFMGTRPLEFSLGKMQSPEPARMLHCIANVRRDSVRLVRRDDSSEESPSYGVELALDADTDCVVTVHQFATEHFSPDAPYRCESKHSSSYNLGPGANIKLCTDDSFVFTPQSVPEEDFLLQLSEDTVFPIVIECTSVTSHDSDLASTQTQVTLCTIVRSADTGAYVLRLLKQKLVSGGVCYLLQEVYGIENKLTPADQRADGDESSDETGGSKDAPKAEMATAAVDEDSRTDCVVCLCELRDTLILPCKHLCLCAACAETLRYKLGTCPICRAPFRALLHMRAMRRLKSVVSAPVIRAVAVGKPPPGSNGAARPAEAYLTTKYENVALIECLNGPVDQTQTCVTAVHPPKAQLSRPATAAALCGRRAKRKHQPPRSAPIQPVFTAGDPETDADPTPDDAQCSMSNSETPPPRPTSIIIDPDRSPAGSSSAADTSRSCTVSAASGASSARPLLSAGAKHTVSTPLQGTAVAATQRCVSGPDGIEESQL